MILNQNKFVLPLMMRRPLHQSVEPIDLHRLYPAAPLCWAKPSESVDHLIGTCREFGIKLESTYFGHFLEKPEKKNITVGFLKNRHI